MERIPREIRKTFVDAAIVPQSRAPHLKAHEIGTYFHVPVVGRP
jgi:hypothetical protein